MRRCRLGEGALAAVSTVVHRDTWTRNPTLSQTPPCYKPHLVTNPAFLQTILVTNRGRLQGGLQSRLNWVATQALASTQLSPLQCDTMVQLRNQYLTAVGVLSRRRRELTAQLQASTESGARAITDAAHLRSSVFWRTVGAYAP